MVSGTTEMRPLMPDFLNVCRCHIVGTQISSTFCLIKQRCCIGSNNPSLIVREIRYTGLVVEICIKRQMKKCPSILIGPEVRFGIMGTLALS